MYFANSACKRNFEISNQRLRIPTGYGFGYSQFGTPCNTNRKKGGCLESPCLLPKDSYTIFM